jgi:hypothetical protein
VDCKSICRVRRKWSSLAKGDSDRDFELGEIFRIGGEESKAICLRWMSDFGCHTRRFELVSLVHVHSRRHPYHACVASLLLQIGDRCGELRDFAFGCRCMMAKLDLNCRNKIGLVAGVLWDLGTR